MLFTLIVSPPPVNMSSHPPAQKPSVLPQPPEPKVAVTAPTVKTALVRPERKLPEPPVEDFSKPNEQAVCSGPPSLPTENVT